MTPWCSNNPILEKVSTNSDSAPSVAHFMTCTVSLSVWENKYYYLDDGISIVFEWLLYPDRFSRWTVSVWTLSPVLPSLLKIC